MKRVIFVLLLAYSVSVFGVETSARSKKYEDITVSKIVSVYDGDTFICDIADYPPIIGKEIRIRIKKINTPEMNDPNPEVIRQACLEKERLKEILCNADRIELRNVARCKYFRILADIYVDGENILPNLNQEYIIPKRRITRTNIHGNTNSGKNAEKTYSKQSIKE